jgi:hypothetical protein
MPEYFFPFAEPMEELMKEMTNEEADYWDDYYTKNPPKVDPAKARYAVRMVAVDDFTADYLVTKAAATRKSPTVIIGELVKGELAREAEPAMTEE